MTQTSPLRRRMIEDMTVRNLSPATQLSCIYAVTKFSRRFNRSPDQLGMEDVRAYQLHLVGQKYSWTHINQVACALRLFYGITLGPKEAVERIVLGKEPDKLPPALNREEIVRFLSAVEGCRSCAPQKAATAFISSGVSCLMIAVWMTAALRPAERIDLNNFAGVICFA